MTEFESIRYQKINFTVNTKKKVKIATQHKKYSYL